MRLGWHFLKQMPVLKNREERKEIQLQLQRAAIESLSMNERRAPKAIRGICEQESRNCGEAEGEEAP